MKYPGWLLPLLWVVVAAPPAQAANVTMHRLAPNSEGVPRSSLSIGNTSYEVNSLTVEGGQRVVVRDATSPLTTDGEHCSQGDPHTVVCDPGTGTLEVAVGLGPYGDRLELLGPLGDTVIYGGSGDDEIRAGGGRDQIWAGGGDDRVYGGPGPDEFLDDEGYPAQFGSDEYVGGAGNDTLFYNGRSNPVWVDLARPSDAGELGEGDRPRQIENLVGGGPRDRLYGTDGPNLIVSEYDRVVAARGGNDTIRVKQTIARGKMSCGAGTDTLDFLNVMDEWEPVALSPDCELLAESDREVPNGDVPDPPIDRHGSVDLRARSLRGRRLELRVRGPMPRYAYAYLPDRRPSLATRLARWRRSHNALWLTTLGRRRIEGRGRVRVLLDIGWRTSAPDGAVFGPYVRAWIHLPR